MKKSKYPRLRTKVYRGKNGQSYSYYTYDNRGNGVPDVRLGTDYKTAVAMWENIHNRVPMTIGRIQQGIDRWRLEVLPTYTVKHTFDQYRRGLVNIESAFGQMAWGEVRIQTLLQYMEKRSAKTAANREMSVFQLVWGKARLWGMTDTDWPALGIRAKDWKNKETPRLVDVTDDLFDAIYQQADRILRDAMDIATSTGMRITDVRTIRMPVNGVLRFKAKKTGKWAEFVVAESDVLTGLVERREAMKANCVMLLASDTGRRVSEWMLNERWNAAKKAAAKANPRLAMELEGLFQRDLRKRAANLADDMESATKLLQHSSMKTTSNHYRSKVDKLKAVR